MRKILIVLIAVIGIVGLRQGGLHLGKVFNKSNSTIQTGDTTKQYGQDSSDSDEESSQTVAESTPVPETTPAPTPVPTPSPSPLKPTPTPTLVAPVAVVEAQNPVQTKRVRAAEVPEFPRLSTTAEQVPIQRHQDTQKPKTLSREEMEQLVQEETQKMREGR